MDDFALPGYEVDELVGFGGTGEVWRARECASGDTVALKRLSVLGAPTQQLHREAALLASVRHEHVVRLRCVVPVPDGLVLVLDFAAGGSLATVLAVGRPLSAGEVVTIGAPLALALSDVHDRGLIHGDVTPANIVFDAAGKPMLADLGVARLVGESPARVGVTVGFADPTVVEGSPPLPASDVFGLAAVCRAALSGAGVAVAAGDAPIRVPAAMLAAIEAALDPDPRARPDAASFARALYASCAPEPVRLANHVGRQPVRIASTHQVVAAAPVRAARPEPERAPMVARRLAPRSRGRHRPARMRGSAFPKRLLLPLGVIALLAGAVGVGVSWAGHDRSAEASAAQQTPAASPAAARTASSAASSAASPPIAGDAGWAKVLTALDETRDQAFADADLDELDGVYVATSSALAADRETLRELIAAGEHARGLNLELTSVAVRSKAATSVVLDVRDVLPGYDLVRADGSANHQPGRAERDWVVTLRATVAGGPWRIDTIAAGQ